MTRNTELNRRIRATIARAAQLDAIADGMRAKLIGNTQEASKAQERASKAVHAILGAGRD